MTDAKTITKEDAKEFHTAARVMLLADGLMEKIDERIQAWVDPVYLAYFEEWDKTLHDFQTVNEALEAWGKFTVGVERLYDLGEHDEQITLQRTHNFGSVSVTIGISRTVSVRSSTHRAGAVKMMDDALDVELERWLRRNAAKVSQGGGAPVTKGASDDGTDQREEAATVLVHDFADGQHRYKVKTPLYSKWGIPLYPEMLNLFGYSEDDLPPLGETDLSGWVVKILFDGGKPKKIVGAKKA